MFETGKQCPDILFHRQKQSGEGRDSDFIESIIMRNNESIQ